MAKILRLYRNTTMVYANFAAAKAKLEETEFVNARKDGEAVLARYTDGPDVKTALGLYHIDVDNKTGVTVLQDSVAVQSLIDALQNELDTTQTSAGLATNGSYVADDTAGSIIGDATSILDADKKLAAAIKQETTNRQAAIEALDDDDSETIGSVVVAVNQVDGKVTASDKKQAQALMLTGFVSTGEAGSLQIAASDTIGNALNKIENYFNGLDLNEVSSNGQPIVKISQSNGQISAEVGDIAAAHVTVADSDDVITATNVEGALTEIAKKVNANAVTNDDHSIIVTTPTDSATTTNVKVNIKSGEGVIKLGNDGIYTDLDIVKVTTGLPTNVAERYQLLNSNDVQIGQNIDIYKDSALHNFYLGHVDDKLTNADSNGESDDDAITNGSGDTALVYVMQLANGKYKLTAVNVQTFLEESEFADGLQVTNHVVSVKKDDTSEKVITVYDSVNGNTESDVITISANGIKIGNIQAAINAAIGTLDVSDTASAGKYVSSVSETDGKITVSRLDISGAPLNSYSKGSDGTAISANDTINQAVSKLENQVDKAKAAAKTVINTAVSGESASHMTITKETTDIDGHDSYSFSLADIASEDALEAEINARKAVDGQSGQTYTANSSANYINNATSLNDADVKLDTQLKSTNDELANTINTITSTNNGIAVGNKSNKSVALTFTLDETTVENAANNQYVSDSGSNVLQITNYGLYLSNVWDCGSY